MLDREFKERLNDFFEGYELVEYLQLPTEEIVERFIDEVEDAQDDLEEFMEHGTKHK